MCSPHTCTLLGDAFSTSHRPDLPFYHVVGRRVQHLLLAKPALLSYSWKHRCILFLLVLLVMEKDGRFVVGGYFFLFLSLSFLSFFFVFQFQSLFFLFLFFVLGSFIFFPIRSLFFLFLIFFLTLLLKFH